MSSRYWCFTLNNYSTENEDTLQADERFRYLIYGHEVGASGTRHLQGYAELHRATTLGALHKRYPLAHFEARRGAATEAADYCKKEDDNYYERGQIIGQGRRTDMDSAITLLRTSGVQAVAREHPALIIRYGRGFRDLQAIEQLRHRGGHTLEVYYGRPGAGKSFAAGQKLPDAYWYPVPVTSPFAGGYGGQTTAIIDDYESWIPYRMLLRMCDENQFQINTCGGFSPWAVTHTIITSNVHPLRWHRRHDDKSALYRRITSFVHCYKRDGHYGQDTYGDVDALPFDEAMDTARPEGIFGLPSLFQAHTEPTGYL